MAFRQTIAFEVDAATGNDANGGGFDAIGGVPGTNRAWGASQSVTAFSDLTTAGAGSTFTSATLTALSGGAASNVGNVINVTGGTNITTGRYQILSQAANTYTVDRAISTGASSDGAGNLGGSLLTIQKGIDCAYINAGAITDCRLYIKKGAYTGIVSLTNSGAVAANGYRCRVIGYNSTHDDDPTPQSGNQPTYAVGSGAGVAGLTIVVNGLAVENITFDGAATSGTRGTTGISATGSVIWYMWNCKIANFSAFGINNGGVTNGMFNLEITNCVSGGISSTASVINECYIHKNTGPGITATANGLHILNCIVANNSGASSDGIVANYNSQIQNNTIYGNGRDGIRSAGSVFTSNISAMWANNIIAKNAGVGLNVTVAPALPSRVQRHDYNAYYSNAGGNYSANIASGDHDVVISINPFVSSDVDLAAETAPNWSLNSTASAGASLRAAGGLINPPGLSTTTNYRDIGAIQHQDSGGGGGATYTGFLMLL